jgi:hypothetical protein
MRFEVVEVGDEWIVRGEDIELARFSDQESALNDVALRLRDADASVPAALRVRYKGRAA